MRISFDAATCRGSSKSAICEYRNTFVGIKGNKYSTTRAMRRMSGELKMKLGVLNVSKHVMTPALASAKKEM